MVPVFSICLRTSGARRAVVNSVWMRATMGSGVPAAARRPKVLLDADLAHLYGVMPKVLIQSVKRNESRFPEDFMFQITSRYQASLNSF